MEGPKVTYTRLMAFIAFGYALFYISTADTIEEPVLWFLAFIVSIWALGRVTLIEAIQLWKGRND